MNAQVDERTKKLKAELEQQLEAERQKLLAEGLSPAVVEQRLKALEAQKMPNLNVNFNNSDNKRKSKLIRGLVSSKPFKIN